MGVRQVPARAVGLAVYEARHHSSRLSCLLLLGELAPRRARL